MLYPDLRAGGTGGGTVSAHKRMYRRLRLYMPKLIKFASALGIIATMANGHSLNLTFEVRLRRYLADREILIINIPSSLHGRGVPSPRTV